MATRILVVDGERDIRASLRERLTHEGYDVTEAENGASARMFLQTETCDLVVLDLRLPDGEGMELLANAHHTIPGAPVLVTTADPSIEGVVEAMRNGAADYIPKPLDMNGLAIRIARALASSPLRRGHSTLLGRQKERFGLANVIGDSPVMTELKRLTRKVAQSETSTVLLLGQTGTGKDMIARAVHYESNRATKPFMNITCTALPESLLESELFGHEKGAFTDAKERKRGLFELADGGTVFLDEVGDMSPGLQAGLLRVLEERAFRRIGGTADVHVDVRIIAATHRNLEQAMEENRFRQDLYFRLSTMPIFLPPLRDHREDIPLLAQHFLDVHRRELHTKAKDITPEAIEKLQAYHWPGNIREFRNAVERAVLLSTGETIVPDDIVLGRPRSTPVSGDLEFDKIRLPADGCDLADVERTLLVQALERTKWNQTRAALLLGLTRDQVRYKVGKHGLKPS